MIDSGPHIANVAHERHVGLRWAGALPMAVIDQLKALARPISAAKFQHVPGHDQEPISMSGSVFELDDLQVVGDDTDGFLGVAIPVMGD